MPESIDPKYVERFEFRHNGPSSREIEQMLEVIGVSSLDELIAQTIPESIRLRDELNLPKAKSETRFLSDFQKMASRNKVFRSFIGMGYYNCHVPGVIQRNIFENPGWYTAYTPYQAEISQGRLEALINFQTMVMDLTGMEIANASLLDEGTAAAEAMSMLASTRKGDKKGANKFFVSNAVFPQTLSVLKSRAQPLNLDLVIGEINELDLSDDALFGVLIQNPDNNGNIEDYSSLFENARNNNVRVAVAADLLSLLLMKSPGQMGADVVVGSTQRFGVPMGYGGPHAAFFATREEYKRQIPGRIIGASVDTRGNNAYRMALQTREQHIRRERATSNICTSQVLLAVMAGMYAVYHGPDGLRKIALRTHGLACILKHVVEGLGFKQINQEFFDTLKLELPDGIDTDDFRQRAEKAGCNFRYFDDGSVGISLDETTDIDTTRLIVDVLAKSVGKNGEDLFLSQELSWPDALIRKDEVLTHPVFNNNHSEHEMLRYLKRLENKDLSLAHSMISLGSCTMKLNATSEMIPVTLREISDIHPFAPKSQTEGYLEMIGELESWLSEITGFHATSLQPNSGAQGEYSGLVVIQAYHRDRGDANRNVTLIPSSAHGTNPASAVMAGTRVVIVECDDNGNIDLQDIKEKAEKYKEDLAALMVTYPSTHGVFEEDIKEICEVVHKYGGLVYMDGANMNAQVGLTSPARIGADVCHLNLHKTFSIPHGGGGPGVGPICVRQDLSPYLPGNPVIPTGGEKAIEAISSAPWGSASVLPISYGYIAMMGVKGLLNATKIAILNANYIKARLEEHFSILYSGINGRCAHEMIVDCRAFKSNDIEVEDIAKRLIDYGFHAPTVSFPVPGTLMIEPTECETRSELDRFCDALVEIRHEIKEIDEGRADPVDNVLKNAPHTAGEVTADEWSHTYSRQKAAYPLSYVKQMKFWPSVSRVDSAYGDRNLVCSCLPVELYTEDEELVNG